MHWEFIWGNYINYGSWLISEKKKKYKIHNSMHFCFDLAYRLVFSVCYDYSPLLIEVQKIKLIILVAEYQDDNHFMFNP